MNVIILATALAYLLLCGVEGQEAKSCTKDAAASFCGCHLKDSANHTVMNITLNFVGKKYAYVLNVSMTCVLAFFPHSAVRHEAYEYTYSPCSSNNDCGDGKAAVRIIRWLYSQEIYCVFNLLMQVCRHIVDDPLGHRSVGSLDSVTYTVDDNVPVATYVGPDG